MLALLTRDDVRLLTLTGTGGTGKTRLALQAAAAAAGDAYPDGVFWAPLAPLRDPALVLEETSRAVGANDGVAEHIADKHLLLLLDNFELAAARTALFSPEQLLDRLSQRLDLLRGDRDTDSRQQTLRATIEWSHDLLSDDEQRLFRRLAGEFLEIARELGRGELAAVFSQVAYVLARVGRAADATHLRSCSETLMEEVGASQR